MPLLNWLTRDSDLKAADQVPYRLLTEEDEHSYGEPSENLLVQGDNLEALKALLPFYAGRVKCIYIDPPYNTGSAFEHYDDALEHSKWLAMMYPRLELLREFLSQDGSIWVSIDDDESHYLKVMMDEIFGRKNFVANVVWQKRTSPDFRSVLGDGHENIFVYAQQKSSFLSVAKLLPLNEKQRKEYKNPDNDKRGPWVSRDFSAQGYRPNQMYKIVSPSGKTHSPPEGSCWKNTEDSFLAQKADGRFYFGKDGNGVPRRKNYLAEAKGRQSWTWWPNEEAGNTQESKKEVIALFGKSNVFDTPKPERLIQRIMNIATDEGDIVFDAFLGSGTTAAVAHKMGRRWMGVEMGEQAKTHCALRLQKVIDGEQGGVSKDSSWEGGGGFRFCSLGSTIFDASGKISETVRFNDLSRHIWFSETKSPLNAKSEGTVIGIHGDKAYALLFNGILKDRSAQGGNVLLRSTLQLIRDDVAKLDPNFDGDLVIYAASTAFGDSTLNREGITFKQTPYDISAQG